jgi:hypothetical protein
MPGARSFFPSQPPTREAEHPIPGLSFALPAAFFTLMQWLNVFGLVLNTAAAVLMFYFPPTVQHYTTEGAAEVIWRGKVSEKRRALGPWRRRMSRAGPQFLIAGFSCQLISAI